MSTSTLSAIPLTTIFTPPASCSPTSVIWGLTGFNSTLYLDREQYSVETKTDCFPSGYSTGSFFSPAPSICPVGYTIACQSVDGSETAAVCCTRFVSLTVHDYLVTDALNTFQQLDLCPLTGMVLLDLDISLLYLSHQGRCLHRLTPMGR